MKTKSCSSQKGVAIATGGIVFVFNQRKIAPVDCFPCRLHVADGFHHVTG